MPVAPTITQFCAVSLSTPHSDGTPSYFASRASYNYPVAGVSLETAASGSTVDIAGIGAMVPNPAWTFTPASWVYVVDVNGTLSTTPPTGSGDYNIAGWALDATTLFVWPQRSVFSGGTFATAFLVSAAAGFEQANPVAAHTLAAKQGIGFGAPATTTPTQNGDLVIEATSNTTLTFKLKGADGTVRTGTLTLA